MKESKTNLSNINNEVTQKTLLKEILSQDLNLPNSSFLSKAPILNDVEYEKFCRENNSPIKEDNSKLKKTRESFKIE